MWELLLVLHNHNSKIWWTEAFCKVKCEKSSIRKQKIRFISVFEQTVRNHSVNIGVQQLFRVFHLFQTWLWLRDKILDCYGIITFFRRHQISPRYIYPHKLCKAQSDKLVACTLPATTLNDISHTIALFRYSKLLIAAQTAISKWSEFIVLTIEKKRIPHKIHRPLASLFSNCICCSYGGFHFHQQQYYFSGHVQPALQKTAHR